jgi:phosphoribosyl 1,2-cyclic phosphate phosphodiesterase
MHLTFLGTSAAEAYPNAFCGCSNCEQARALGGPNLRKRSCALIDDHLLIDLGPDLMAASTLHGRSLAGLRYCLQTHAHADHLDVAHFLVRSPEYGVPAAPRLHFYGSSATVRRAARLLETDLGPDGLLDPAVGDRLNLTIHQIAPFEPLAVGPYRVTAFPATHDPAVEPLLYVIEGDGRTIFYSTDTAPLSEDVWRAFGRHGLRFDVAILDHTYDDAGDTDHLNAEQFSAHVARLRAEDRLAPAARVLGTHFSHAVPVHAELVARAARHGYEIAYDGLTV